MDNNFSKGMGILNQITLKNFLGYYNQASIKFALPSGKPGSGLTLIVGEINSGKSSIFEAIKKLLPDAKFLPQERNPRSSSPTIEFYATDNTVTRLTLGPKGDVKTAEDGLIKWSTFELIPSRRHWEHAFSSNSVSSYDSYRANGFRHSSKYATDSNLGSLLDKIAADVSKKKDFDKKINILFPSFTDWKIDCNDQGRYIVVYYINENTTHDTSLIGDGLVSLFRICAHLTLTKNELVLYIDEPEVSLSPFIQKKIAHLLAQESKDKQIIVNTHSPQMIRWEDIKLGAKLHRTKKNPDGACEIKTLDSETEAFKKLFCTEPDWQKPHLLDVVAKEIFFSEKAFFLEGQEDVGLIKKYIKENNLEPLSFDIFGYGCGGIGNIPYYFEISKSLGIKAAALFDKSPENETDIERAKKYEKDNDKQFKVLVHNYEDIREKKQTEKNSAKTGLFEENGKIQREKKKELDDMFEDIKCFFE